MSLSTANNNLAIRSNGSNFTLLPVHVQHIPPSGEVPSKPIPLPGYRVFKSSACCPGCGRNGIKADQESKKQLEECCEESKNRCIEAFKSSFRSADEIDEESSSPKEMVRVTITSQATTNNLLVTQLSAKYFEPLTVRVGHFPLFSPSFPNFSFLSQPESPKDDYASCQRNAANLIKESKDEEWNAIAEMLKQYSDTCNNLSLQSEPELSQVQISNFKSNIERFRDLYLSKVMFIEK